MDLEQTKAVSSDSGRTYELVGELGRGGFGAVYKARHTGEAGFARLVAIKMLHDEGSSRPEYANRLRDEARLLSRLRHRAIVAVDDLVCLDGRWAVVMEYVEGEDLLALIRRGALPPRVACEIALEVASGLRVIHGAKDPSTKRMLGIVHRDLKPSNIRITPHGEVKLLDFGIARAAFPGREAVTGSVRFESVGYVAPERMFGMDTAGSDIFSLGVVLYECLTGQRMGPLPERQGAYEALRDRSLEKLNEVLPEPGPTRVVISRMLAFEDRDRPTAALTVDLLRDLTQDLPGPWLASWASELLGRSRYGDPEDYAAAGMILPGPASTESLAVLRPKVEDTAELDAEEDEPVGPPPTIGLSLPAARPPAVMDALVPAPEDLDSDEVLVAPVQASEEAPIFSRPPAPPPPPSTLAIAAPPPGAAAPAPSPAMSEVIPPVAGWFLGAAAALLLLGVGTIAGIAAWRPDLLRLSEAPLTEEPAPEPPAEPPPVVAAPDEPAPPAESPPVVAAPTEPTTAPAPTTAPPAEAAPEAPAPTTAATTPAEERTKESVRVSPTSGKASGGGRPKAPTAAPAAATGRVLVRGNFDKAELDGTSGRIPAGEAPPGSYKVRVRFAKELAWVETGLTVTVEAGKTTIVECSYESEACRISR